MAPRSSTASYRILRRLPPALAEHGAARGDADRAASVDDDSDTNRDRVRVMQSGDAREAAPVVAGCLRRGQDHALPQDGDFDGVGRVRQPDGDAKATAGDAAATARHAEVRRVRETYWRVCGRRRAAAVEAEVEPKTDRDCCGCRDSGEQDPPAPGTSPRLLDQRGEPRPGVLERLYDGARIDSTMREIKFEHVAAEIRRAIADGEAKPGERLPPARDLAAVLGVNTNTVLRALRLLRDEGLLEFRRGRGVNVIGSASRGAVVQRARELVHFARDQGYRPDELIQIIRQLG